MDAVVCSFLLYYVNMPGGKMRQNFRMETASTGLNKYLNLFKISPSWGNIFLPLLGFGV